VTDPTPATRDDAEHREVSTSDRSLIAEFMEQFCNHFRTSFGQMEAISDQIVVGC
jgi:hypothetical protein